MGHSVNHQVFKSVQALNAEIINLLETANTLTTAKNNNFADDIGRQAFTLLKVAARLRTILTEHSAWTSLH